MKRARLYQWVVRIGGLNKSTCHKLYKRVRQLLLDKDMLGYRLGVGVA